MKAVVITQPGLPEVLKIKEESKPQIGRDEILIKVRAIGINRPDVAQREGKYPAPEGVPKDIPGLEVSGWVADLGENVKTWEIGDKVCALLAGGGYAEYVAVPQEQCLTIPEGLSLEEAASLPETFFTVWNNVFQIGNFKKDEIVLVHGGSSGIGVAAIQMVKAMGGQVIVTAGSEEKCETCLDLGASLAINYKEQDFEVEVEKHLGNKKVDIVLDMVGGSYTIKNLRLLNRKGRLIMINAMENRMGEVDLLRIMSHQLVITGSTLRPQSKGYKGHIATNLMEKIWPLFPDKIKPVIHTAFPMEAAAEAHKLLESSNHIGKILLLV
ncbi:NAD(P)H-quinone oxidoreductase [Cyclobacterium marinum]|uniref:NAD(P)H quinone oxidoreductase, PIG3 family n=1 Tax=Cyclobacterium marinum (strain ATCC 25205 / DSM 745 / LMG 13164 / NCIMB 1802) TaxID=880070 RepID=G0IYQ0_CYCMS|nr:NAD(P)H-quinone oxidoreductase [Cyclobacterium marinum]AEL27233.1 NAD(P)H quinone oxidoreductase, PIG3 family [Cyclobacterium marinum DSM 745]